MLDFIRALSPRLVQYCHLIWCNMFIVLWNIFKVLLNIFTVSVKYFHRLAQYFHRDFSQLRICRLDSGVAIYAWKMPTVLYRMKNLFSDFYFLSLVDRFYILRWHVPGFSSLLPTKKKTVKSCQIYRRDAQWAETSEKSIFRFIVLRYGRFFTEIQKKIC